MIKRVHVLKIVKTMEGAALHVVVEFKRALEPVQMAFLEIRDVQLISKNVLNRVTITCAVELWIARLARVVKPAAAAKRVVNGNVSMEFSVTSDAQSIRKLGKKIVINTPAVRIIKNN